MQRAIPFPLLLVVACGLPPSAAGPADHGTVEVLVVQSFHDEDGSILLELGRGSAAGLRVGQEGRLLDAATGETTFVPHASFMVEQVTDADHAVARSRDVQSNGTFMRNRHAVITLK